MFQHPQESRLAPMRDKLLFIEALTASGDLTGRELRVAILLTMHYSTTHGCAKPSMVRIAAALGIDKGDTLQDDQQSRRQGVVLPPARQLRPGWQGPRQSVSAERRKGVIGDTVQRCRKGGADATL
jgi:hypothetical protein